MWFRNRLVNPVVRWLLRSPLHPLLSRSLVILSYQGRKTGRWRSLPCMYARDGQDLYVVPGQPERKVWWRNLCQPTPVRLRLQGRDLEGTATASSDPETVAAGLRRYLARYPKTAKPLRVRLDRDGTVTASRPLVVVTVHLVDPTGSTDGGPASA
jgi:F420H(2)-dependent quinone reductase